MLLLTKYSLYKTNVNMGMETFFFSEEEILYKLIIFFLKKCTK